jgi:hypothetical protein
LDKSARTIVALLIVALLVAFVAWFDNGFLAGAEQEAARSFRMAGYALWLSVGYLVVAGSVLAVAVAARWAGSLWVGIVYSLVGAFFAFLRAIYFGPAGSASGAPSILPAALARLVADTYQSTGPLDATAILGAGLLIVGVGTIVWVVRQR